MEYKAGDLIGFSGAGPVSDIINVATFGIPRWNLSHIGIIAEHKDRLILFESTSICAGGKDCILQQRPVEGVQAHRLRELAERPGRVWHYPLTRALYRTESRRLTFFLLGQLGKEYDLRGAVRSGGLLIRTLAHILRAEDLGQMFCSELCAAAYSQAGLLPTSNASSYNPNSFVRRARRAGLLKPRVRIK